MSRWGDDIDEELKRKEKIKVGFMFSFKGMSHVVRQIEETTKEWDDKYFLLVEMEKRTDKIKYMWYTVRKLKDVEGSKERKK